MRYNTTIHRPKRNENPKAPEKSNDQRKKKARFLSAKIKKSAVAEEKKVTENFREF